MIIKIIEFGSAEYQQMIALRIEALLKPIHIDASYIVPEKEENDTFIGAFESGHIIGCCVLTRQSSTVLQLRQMAVKPSLQGKYIGTAILGFAESEAKRQLYKILMMHARDPVIRFYQKSGYQIVGEQFFEVGMGHHKLQKLL